MWGDEKMAQYNVFLSFLERIGLLMKYKLKCDVRSSDDVI